jgi:uncharacterized delta-60 repeat protein
MAGRRRTGARIVLVALLAVLAVTGVALAAARRGGSLDPTFGKDGRVVVALPESASPSQFGPIAPAAGGRLLVAYGSWALGESFVSVIERREPDGALDPSFGRGGSVKVRGGVTALAEDPSGGVIYGGYGTIGRLLPDGAKDKAFDGRHPTRGSFAPVKIAFDAAGRILAGGSVSTGARYHAHEGQSAIMRLDPDGRRDASFGTGGVAWLGQELVSASLGGEFGLLPDGSILVLGTAVEHLAADGTVLPTPKVTDDEKPPSSLVVFPDGSFATASSPLFSPGCTVVRYRPDGSPDPAFAQAGTFIDPGLSECRMQLAPEGGLLIRGVDKTNDDEGTPKLLLLTATGAPAAGFGSGGAVSIPQPTAAAAGGAGWQLQGVAFSPGGQLTVAGGGGDSVGQEGVATLVGLTASGAIDPAFGTGGTVVQSALPPSSTSPRSVVAEPDGELIVSGLTDSGRAFGHPFWMRFGANGKLIPTSSGAPFRPMSRPASELHPAGPGKVYALIHDSGVVIAELTVGGTPVRGFGEDGYARLPDDFRSSSFVVGADGGVTVLGHDRESGRMVAFRLTAAGRPDGRFGRHGLATVRVPGVRHGAAKAGVALPGGGVVLLGTAEEHFAAVMLGPDGRPRRGFGDDGLLRCRCGGIRPSRVDAVLHRGHIYVLAHGVTEEGELTALVKLDLGGRLDRSFAGRGWRKAQLGGNSVALFARGDRLLAVGQQGYFTGPSTVREFRLDGTEDRSYKARASVFAGGRKGVARLSAAMQADGRLVLVGEKRAKLESEGSRLELLGLR